MSRYAPDIEIEAKFRITDRETANLLISAPSVAGGAATVAHPPARYEDHYLDTPDGLLRRAGWTLRLRHIESRVLASLKSIVAAERDGVHSRIEIENWAIDDPDPASWPRSVVKRRALELLDGRKPVFQVTVRQDRTARMLRVGRTTVELTVDEVSIIAASGVVLADWTELEIELASGTPATLARIARKLNAEFPGLVEEPRSKGERALLAAAGIGRAA